MLRRNTGCLRNSNIAINVGQFTQARRYTALQNSSIKT